MKNKKAIVLPETLKLIIAVLCIMLLIYLAVSLYGLFFKKTAIEQAKENLKQMSIKINKIEKSEKSENQFLLESPSKWFLIAFPYKDGVETPKQCNKYCICICPLEDKSNALKDCSSLGACVDVSMKIETVNDAPIYIKGPSLLRMRLVNNKIVVETLRDNL